MKPRRVFLAQARVSIASVSPYDTTLSTIIRKRCFLSVSPAISSAPRAQIVSFIFLGVRYDRPMPTVTHTSTEGLRLRRCLHPTCNAMFAICRCCDSDQRYCRDECRQRMRRLQVVAAGRRYQSSEAGQQAHRQRQRAHRERSSRCAGVRHERNPRGYCSTVRDPCNPARRTRYRRALAAAAHRGWAVWSARAGLKRPPQWAHGVSGSPRAS